MSMDKSLILVIESAGDGGTEVYVEALARYMALRGPVEIVTLSGNAETAKNRFLGLQTTALPNVTALRGFLRDRPGSIVNFHLYSSLWPAARIVLAERLPILVTLHLPLAQWNAWHRLKWRLAVATADGIVGASRACLLGFGPLLRMKSTNVVSGPVPLERLPAPIVVSRKLNAPQVLFVGRLEYQKDLPTLLRAMKRWNTGRLDVVGDGSERKRCEMLADELGLNVNFHGALNREDVLKVMRNADIFVLPSRFEGLGIAAIEAMALGVPTVVADFPAASDYIQPERTGLTFPVGDHKVLAECLERLTEDHKLRQTLSAEGAKYVRQVFSAEAQFGKYTKLIDNISKENL